jgi:hypothetical protein
MLNVVMLSVIMLSVLALSMTIEKEIYKIGTWLIFAPEKTAAISADFFIDMTLLPLPTLAFDTLLASVSILSRLELEAPR